MGRPADSGRSLMANAKPQTEVKPGQIWRDNDKRSATRYLKVLRLDDPINRYAICVRVLQFTEGGPWRTPNGKAQRKITIAIARMRPRSNGYVLVQEAK
jgi:hypothetical protein